ncbi:MAG: hypothetical protein EXR59_00965 [Dehalococcoidia bacterium]|nr:hypothetical protein [Dehalococcoidia bacterium]
MRAISFFQGAMRRSRLALITLTALATFLMIACSSTPAQRPTVTAAAPTAVPSNAAVSETDALLTTLSHGGFVIFLRHGNTDRTIQPSLTGPSWWKSCDPPASRQLSDKGREQARTIGKALNARDILVGTVYSSEYCRAIETARLAFGRTETVFELNWLTSDGDEPSDLGLNRLVMKQLISTQPPSGKNTVIVGHSFNLEGVSTVVIEEGDAVIFQPIGNGNFNVIGKMTAEQLSEYLK